MHKQVKIFIFNEEFFVDKKLVETIYILNKHGLKTYSSCQCDPDGNTWIAFTNYKSFMTLCKLSKNSKNKELWQFLSSNKCKAIIDINRWDPEYNFCGLSLYFNHKYLQLFQNLLINHFKNKQKQTKNIFKIMSKL